MLTGKAIGQDKTHTNLMLAAPLHLVGDSAGCIPAQAALIGYGSITAPGSTKGESLFKQYMTKEYFMHAANERRKSWLAPRSTVQCASTLCTAMLTTGPNSKFYQCCGANQDTEETKLLKEVLNKIKL